MAAKKKNTERLYLERRKRILRQIKGQVAIFPAAPVVVKSRDLDYPFRQNSDFFYLTGFDEPEAILVLLGSSKGPRSIIFLRDRLPEAERWTGERLGIKRAKRKFEVDEILDIESFSRKLPEMLIGTEVLHYAPGANPRTDSLLWNILKSSREPSYSRPHTLKDSRLLTASLRVVKDKSEIAKIRHATQITCKALLSFIPQMRQAKSERHATKLLEAHFTRLGAEGPSFPTIMASGRHATVLHHTPTFHPLWKRELVLIDCGALFQGYAADITRCIPISGRFSEPQAEVYDLVHAALKAGILKSTVGSSLSSIHNAAVRTITAGLIELGLLEGKLNELIATKAYTKFFMHRTGHWLGLDVHDISPIHCDGYLLPEHERPLEAGNVFTIEPGLYFDPKDHSIPEKYRGIGIRLEEDVLITNRGSEILTSEMPIAREDIETLLQV